VITKLFINICQRNSVSVLFLLTKYSARWPVTVLYFPLISSLDIQLILVLLADNVKLYFGILPVFILFMCSFHFL
jgi:hypothetical protein